MLQNAKSMLHEEGMIGKAYRKMRPLSSPNASIGDLLTGSPGTQPNEDPLLEHQGMTDF